MQCAACGATAAPGKRFCADCGAPLGLACPSCGSAVQSGQRFCADCGTPLGSPEALSAPPARSQPASAPVTERRVCSVLFCDLVGFTPLSEARDPEEVRELLSRYFDEARTIIERYGGTVEKFIGDAVMAVWGTPTATEGDAERSVRAALDLVDAVVNLGHEVGADGLAARAGVVTGEVAVTVGAVGQGMVAGDTVNTAARIQATADAGQVLVDETTWRLVRSAISGTRAGSFALKGKTEPVELWRAEHVVSAIGGASRIDGLEAPLVGRDAEMRLVRELFHATADRHTARLVSIVGPAGVGKSRLGWEFFKYVDGLKQNLWWHRGRCLSYGDGVAFFALAEMMRQRLGIAEDDDSATAAHKLRVGLEKYVSDDDIREYLYPRVARLLGVESPSEGSLGREDLFAGWRTFFEQLAATEPVVLVIEDFQYADDGLLDFVEHLLDWARDVPIFVLTLSRPEIEDRRPGWGAGRRNATALTLEVLDDASMHRMIDGLVNGLPETARSAIAGQAQGIPLYAVETVRMLIDRDVVQPREGTYRLVGDIGELSVPESLQSLLAARLDSLPDAERRLVSDAAVIGTTFPVSALIAVSDQDESTVRRLLADLVRREVLTVRADRLSPDQGQYGFVQTMFRQVAYDTLSRRERKLRHVTVADNLATAFADEGEEVTEVIAQHLLDAMEAVPDAPDVAELRGRAVATLVRAGRRAQRTGAPAVAGASFARAAQLVLDDGTGNDEERAAELFEEAGRLYEAAADRSGVETACRTAADLYGRLGRARDQARVQVPLSNSLRRQGRIDEATEVLEPAVKTLRDHVDADTVAGIAQMGQLHWSRGEPAECLRVLEEAFDLAQNLLLPSKSYPDLFLTVGLAHSSLDHYVQASAAYREAIRLSTELGDTSLTGRGLLNLSDCLLSAGSLAEAEEVGGEGALVLRNGGVAWFTWAVGNQVQALLLLGQWDKAHQLSTQTVQDPIGAADPYLAWVASMVFLLRGDIDAATELLPTVRTLQSSQDPQDLVNLYGCEALFAWSRGDMAESLNNARLTLEHAERAGFASEGSRWSWTLAANAALALGDLDEVRALLALVDERPAGKVSPVARADAYRVRARLLAAEGDAGAPTAFEEATRGLRELTSPWHLAVGLADHADYCMSTGDTVIARTLADEARSIATQLGAKPLLQRLDRAFATVG
jgi:class 3 adenylate cyclase/tetratricopeptide (TPR) repeat protein